MTTLFDADRAMLNAVLADQPAFRTQQIWEGLYRHHKFPHEMSNVSRRTQQLLASELPTALHQLHRSVAADATVKYLWELTDGRTIETVLMPYERRTTVCISSQAGCAMACGFCATGQAGFERHLTSGEIVEQVIRACRDARPERVSNIVFMGMGEPLSNYDHTVNAVRRLHHDVGISARHITVSTVGIVPGIDKLCEFELPINLAVSLHAANDSSRDELVPINRRYNLDKLHESLNRYRRHKNRRISFEWALIEGVNDTDRDAQEFADYARSLGAHINVIPLNPTPGYPVVGTSPQRVVEFVEALNRRGANATVRRNRGTTIDGACGQLRQRHREQPASPTEIVLGRRDRQE